VLPLPMASHPTLYPVASVLFIGPYLVRSASISGYALAVRSDLNTETALEALAPSAVRRAIWSGKAVAVSSTAQSALKGVLQFGIKRPTLPSFKALNLACTDLLPEA